MNYARRSLNFCPAAAGPTRNWRSVSGKEKKRKAIFV